MAKALLVCVLLSALLASVFATTTPGGWRFANGASDLGDVEIKTNLTVNGTSTTVRAGDISPYEPSVSVVEITVSSDNLPVPITKTFTLPAGYNTIVFAGTGSAPEFNVASDAISSAVKSVGGSLSFAIRLINGLNETVTLKYNGTGYADHDVASTLAFADASDYSTLPSGDLEGLFYVVDSMNAVIAQSDIGSLGQEVIYSLFLTEDNTGKLKLKLFTDLAVTVSYVRVVHGIQGLGKKNKLDVDILYTVNANTSVAANISYFYVTDYSAIEPGTSGVAVKIYGLGTQLVTQTFNNFSNYSIILSGTENDTVVTTIVDNLQGVNTSALVRFINLVDVPEISVTIADSSNSSSVVGYNATTPEQDFDTFVKVNGASTVKGVIIGGKSASPVDYTFEKNSVYTVWVYGTPTKPQLFVSQDYPTPPTSKGLSNLELGLIIAGAIMFVILLLAIIIFAVRSRPAEGYERIEN